MYKSFSMELAGRTLTVDVGRVAAQANGAAFMHYGDTTVLSTATASDKPRDGIDFFPLSVEYEEKLYAVGKDPRRFQQERGQGIRECDPDIPCHRPSHASAVPEGLPQRRDPEQPGDVCGSRRAARSWLPCLVPLSQPAISDIPFDGPCAMYTGRHDRRRVYHQPEPCAEKKLSDLHLTVASTREKVIMIEAGANESSGSKDDRGYLSRLMK